jgi:hypothetical protein
MDLVISLVKSDGMKLLCDVYYVELTVGGRRGTVCTFGTDSHQRQ